MCTGFEGTLLSAALSGAGMLLQQQAASDAAKEQRNILNQQQEETTRIAKAREGAVQDFASKTFDPTTRMQNYETQATKAEDSLVNDLLKENDGSAAKLDSQTDGNLSADYIRGKAKATSDATADILKRAHLMARSGAGGLLYSDEGIKSGDLATEMSMLNNDQNRVNNNTNSRLSTVRNNGSLAGGLLMGLAPAAGQLKVPKSLSIYGSGD